MKKKITTGPELLSHIAASGDAAAFYALVSPSLREYFFKLRSNGETIEESSEKIIECAISLFKKFQHTDPDDFEDWLKSELETFSGRTNNDSEVVLDKQLFLQCDTVLADAQKQLLRTANTLRCGSRKRGVLAFPGRHKTIFTLVAASIIISALFVVLFGFYGMRADISFSKNDLLFKEKNTVRDTTASSVGSADSVKKSDSTISVAAPVTPVQEPKPVPPPPRPRPRVTHTPPPPPPPAAANDLSESNQTSQPIPDQVPQTASSRPERTNQQPGYTSQSQTTESQPVPSYSSSGNTSSTTLQPSQQQILTSQEQNQP